MLAAFLALSYFTGQRPGDVAKMRRNDVQDGALRVRQAKTGARVRIELLGPLATLVTGLKDSTIRSLFVIHDARGQHCTRAALRKPAIRNRRKPPKRCSGTLRRRPPTIAMSW